MIVPPDLAPTTARRKRTGRVDRTPGDPRPPRHQDQGITDAPVEGVRRMDSCGSWHDGGVEVLPQLEVFEHLPDLVVVFDASLTIKYVNFFARRLLGHEDTVLETQTLVEFLHPDDLGRAAEVAGLIADKTLIAETTPAVYRLR